LPPFPPTCHVCHFSDPATPRGTPISLSPRTPLMSSGLVVCLECLLTPSLIASTQKVPPSVWTFAPDHFFNPPAGHCLPRICSLHQNASLVRIFFGGTQIPTTTTSLPNIPTPLRFTSPPIGSSLRFFRVPNAKLALLPRCVLEPPPPLFKGCWPPPQGGLAPRFSGNQKKPQEGGGTPTTPPVWNGGEGPDTLTPLQGMLNPPPKEG